MAIFHQLRGLSRPAAFGVPWLHCREHDGRLEPGVNPLGGHGPFRGPCASGGLFRMPYRRLVPGRNWNEERLRFNEAGNSTSPATVPEVCRTLDP